MELILASGSPRRAELLKYITEDFKVIVSGADENILEVLSPSELVMELARIKAGFVSRTHQGAVVIGSDTVVAVDDDILGKPRDKEEAAAMLRKLSGRAHSVYTGVALQQGERYEQFYSRTDVYFSELCEEEIACYVATDEPYDKAGGYGIQGHAALYCERIEGDYFTVMGLPVALLNRRLTEFTAQNSL